MGRTALFSFSGRIGRQGFWLTWLGVLLYLVLLVMLGMAINGDAGWLSFLALMLPGFAVGMAASTRRLHDRDRSGWWLLFFCLLPPMLGSVAQAAGELGWLLSVLGLGLLLWGTVELGFLKGRPGANRYGADPLDLRGSRHQADMIGAGGAVRPRPLRHPAGRGGPLVARRTLPQMSACNGRQGQVSQPGET
jgi:uncharacterized membrane protein YhaH (DUF805 family)